MFSLVTKGSQRNKIAMILIGLIILFGSDYLLQMMHLGHSSIQYFSLRIVIILIAIINLFTLGTNKITSQRIGYRRPVRTAWILTIICLVIVFMMSGFIINVAQVIEQPNHILQVLVMALSAGMFEETVCRGLMFSVFANMAKNGKHPLLWAGILNSAIFGLLHLNNYFSNGQGLNITVQQVFYAFAIGLTFSVVHIATNGLWVGIILHTLFDFQPTISSAITQANNWIVLLIIFVPIIIIAIFYLVKADSLVKPGMDIRFNIQY